MRDSVRCRTQGDRLIPRVHETKGAAAMFKALDGDRVRHLILSGVERRHTQTVPLQIPAAIPA
jgi:hypothetical protein